MCAAISVFIQLHFRSFFKFIRYLWCSLPSSSHGHLRIHLTLGFLIPVFLPLRNHAMPLVAGLLGSLLVSCSSVQNILCLLKVIGLALHVQATEWNFRIRRVVNIELFWTQVHQILIWLILGKPSWFASKIARHFRV